MSGVPWLVVRSRIEKHSTGPKIKLPICPPIPKGRPSSMLISGVSRREFVLLTLVRMRSSLMSVGISGRQNDRHSCDSECALP